MTKKLRKNSCRCRCRCQHGGGREEGKEEKEETEGTLTAHALALGPDGSRSRSSAFASMHRDNTAGELAVDDRLARSDRMAAVPLSSSGSAHLDQMAAGLLGVREKKQQREQSVAGWLERSKSPQLMGVSNENTARAQAFTLSREVIFKLFARYVPRSSPTCEKTAQQRDQSVAGWLEKLPGGLNNSDAARALTLDPYRERLVLLGVMLCACYKTAAVSAVRNIHDVVLERPQSPQLPGGFRCSDTARAQTLDPYRERLVLLGVLLFQVACNTVIST